MFLYTLHKEYPEVHPADTEHIAAFIDIAEMPDVIKSANERRFLASVKKDIHEILSNYTTTHTLPVKETVDVLEVDIRVER